MTQSFFGVLEFSGDCDLRNTANRILGHAAKIGLGVLLGREKIVSYNSDVKLEIVQDLLEETGNGLPFELTSDPTDDNVQELFESELNVARGVEPSRSRLISFIRSLWNEPDLVGGRFVLCNVPPVQKNELRRVRVSLEEFIKHLTDYYRILFSGDSTLADGIFEISKTSR